MIDNSIEGHGAASTFGSLINNVSHSRVQMVFSHLSQVYIPDETELPILFHSMESEQAKYVDSIQAPCDMLVLGYIPRYNKMTKIDGKRSIESTVIYLNQETSTIEHIIIRDYSFNHEKFGYQLSLTKHGMSLPQLGFFEKGTILAASGAIKNGFYCGGARPLNTVFLSKHATIEDGMLMSRQALDKFKTKMFKKYTTICGTNWYPLNIHGDINNYKPFLLPGEKLARSDGLLMAFRNFNQDTMAYDFSPEGLMDFDPQNDIAFYSEEGVTVVDMTVYNGRINSPRKSFMPSEMENNLQSCLDSNEDYAVRVRDAFTRIMKECHGMDASEALKAHIATLYRYQGTAGGAAWTPWKDKLCKFKYRGEVIEDWHISCTVMKSFVPDESAKFSNYYGAKGVICKIVDESEMPRDKFGNVAEVVINMAAIPARLIPGFPKEQFYTAYAREMTKTIHALVDDKRIEEAMDYALTGYRYLSESMYNILSQDSKLLREHILEVRKDIVRFDIAVQDKKITPHEVFELMKIIPLPRDKILHLNSKGEWKESLSPALLAPVSFFALEKSHTEAQSTNAARSQHHGLPAKVTRMTKDSTPTRQQALRHLSESEFRQIGARVGYDAMVTMLSRTTNPYMAEEIAVRLSRDPNPSNPGPLTSPAEVSKGTPIPIEMFKHFLDCYGVEMVKSDD